MQHNPEDIRRIRETGCTTSAARKINWRAQMNVRIARARSVADLQEVLAELVDVCAKGSAGLRAMLATLFAEASQ